MSLCWLSVRARCKALQQFKISSSSLMVIFGWRNSNNSWYIWSCLSLSERDKMLWFNMLKKKLLLKAPWRSRIGWSFDSCENCFFTFLSQSWQPSGNAGSLKLIQLLPYNLLTFLWKDGINAASHRVWLTGYNVMFKHVFVVLPSNAVKAQRNAGVLLERFANKVTTSVLHKVASLTTMVS